MYTIIYYTGNGYNCGCCRQSTTDYLIVDDYMTEEQAIQELASISLNTDDDFGISDMPGYDGSIEEFEQRIAAVVKQKQVEIANRNKLLQLKKDIKFAEEWFVNLDKNKAERLADLNAMHKQLAELEGT